MHEQLEKKFYTVDDDYFNTKNYQNFCVASILLVEILSEEEKDISKQLVEISLIMHNLSHNPQHDNFIARFAELVVACTIFENQANKMIIIKVILC